MSRPPKWIRPASGVISPVNSPISVVLPAPFGPIMACSSPAGSASEIASEATTPPKRLVKASTASKTSATAHSGHQAVDPAVHADGDDKGQWADHQIGIIGDMRQRLLQQQEGHRANQRPEHSVHAA